MYDIRIIYVLKIAFVCVWTISYKLHKAAAKEVTNNNTVTSHMSHIAIHYWILNKFTRLLHFIQPFSLSMKTTFTHSISIKSCDLCVYMRHFHCAIQSVHSTTYILTTLNDWSSSSVNGVYARQQNACDMCVSSESTCVLKWNTIGAIYIFFIVEFLFCAFWESAVNKSGINWIGNFSAYSNYIRHKRTRKPSKTCILIEFEFKCVTLWAMCIFFKRKT